MQALPIARGCMKSELAQVGRLVSSCADLQHVVRSNFVQLLLLWFPKLYVAAFPLLRDVKLLFALHEMIDCVCVSRWLVLAVVAALQSLHAQSSPGLVCSGLWAIMHLAGGHAANRIELGRCGACTGVCSAKFVKSKFNTESRKKKSESQ